MQLKLKILRDFFVIGGAWAVMYLLIAFPALFFAVLVGLSVYVWLPEKWTQRVFGRIHCE